MQFWDEAFVLATYIINRLPSHTTKNISPYEFLYHHAPNYSFLKVFSCACFPYLKPYNKHKLDYKSQQCVFIGYAPNHKGYKCLSLTNRLYVSRNVVFDEHVFAYQQLFCHFTTSAPSLSNNVPSILVVVPNSATFSHVANNANASASIISNSYSVGSTFASVASTPPGSARIEIHLPIFALVTNAPKQPIPPSVELVLGHLTDASQPPMQPSGHISLNIHSMQTRAKNIFKPKIKSYLAVFTDSDLDLTQTKPKTVSQVLQSPTGLRL